MQEGGEGAFSVAPPPHMHYYPGTIPTIFQIVGHHHTAPKGPNAFGRPRRASGENTCLVHMWAVYNVDLGGTRPAVKSV